MPWNPLGPSGLLSNPAEWHALIVGVVATLIVLALHKQGYKRAAALSLLSAFLASLMLSIDGIAWKTWYFGGPLSLSAIYFIIDSWMNKRNT